MTDQNLSHRAQLAKEIEDALRTSALPLSSAELNGMCPSAQDSTDIGRVIYYLRDQGIVAESGAPIKVPGRNPTKTWGLCSQVAADVGRVPAPVTDAMAADIDAEIAALTDLLKADAVALPTLREILAEQDADTMLRAAEYAALAIKALESSKGDDAARARASFRGMTPEQMAEDYGLSGVSRAQILRDYEDHEAKADAAIEWIRSMSTGLPVTVLPGTYSHDRPAAAGHCAEIPVTQAEDDFCDHCMSRLETAPRGERCDPTELALADLVDEADENMLSLADHLLGDNPAWLAARQLSDSTFEALCGYRARCCAGARP